MQQQIGYKHPIGRLRCFAFDNQLNLRDSYSVKTKAFSNAFYVYTSPPTVTKRNIGVGHRKCKE